MGRKTNNGDELEKNLPCLPILIYIYLFYHNILG